MGAAIGFLIMVIHGIIIGRMYIQQRVDPDSIKAIYVMSLFMCLPMIVGWTYDVMYENSQNNYKHGYNDGVHQKFEQVIKTDTIYLPKK